MPDGHQALENLLSEERLFPPPADFAANSNARPGIHEAAEADWQTFWLDQALERLSWFKPPSPSTTPTLRSISGSPTARSTSRTTASIATWRPGDKVAYHWVGEPGDSRTLTYGDLHARSASSPTVSSPWASRRAIRPPLYMGMVPELPVAMLACARLGIVHCAVFGGFSSDALADRINDASAKS